ncbi:MAG: efflux RND transporter periplasmic adaptor subunit [Chthoniobacteraceae bacterium]
MKKLFTLLIVAAVGCGGWYAYAHRSALTPGLANEAADKFVAKAEKRDIDSTVEVSGDVTPAFQIDVKSEVGGRVKVLRVQPGDLVKEGDVLVEIDDRDLLSEKESALTEIEGAKLTMQRAKNNFDRGKELADSKLVSQEVFDNLNSEYAIAQNGLTKAERKLQLVEDRLRKTKVLAAMDGTVLAAGVPLVEGQVVIAAASVNSGTTLMTIANLSKLLVDMQINQVDYRALSPNQIVKLRAESLKDIEMEAKISFISPVAVAKNSVKGFQVKALIDRPHERLRPGMTVNIVIPIDSADDAVSVPISAVFKGEGRSKVVYVRKGDSTEKRAVKIGVTNTDFAKVLSGVTVGEEILLVEPGRVAQKKS